MISPDIKLPIIRSFGSSFFSSKVRPNQIWQDHRPREYNQTVRVVLILPYLIGLYFSIELWNCLPLETKRISQHCQFLTELTLYFWRKITSQYEIEPD